MSLGLNPFATTWFPPKNNVEPEPDPDEEEVPPTNDLLQRAIRYGSSIDSISNLFAGIAYKDDRNKKPICVLMHGWNGTASDYHPSKTVEFAEYGFFSIAVGMRGRDGASGVHDANGRELYDVIDAVEYVKRRYPNEVDKDNIVVAGYSGGGGNNFGLASKFPDYFNAHAAHFGLSDVGYHEDYSWWATAIGRRGQIEGRVGARIPENIGNYYSRAHQFGSAKNFSQGFMFIYHDRGDGVVTWRQSQLVADEFQKLNRDNYSLDITETTDNPRWLHQQPDVNSQVIHTRDEWGPLIINNEIPSWSVPDSGELLVQGYVKTKKFEIWLGNGKEHVAELTYNLNENVFNLTSLTGEVEATIIIDGNERKVSLQ